MKRSIGSNPSLVGILVIILFFLSLIVIPKVTAKKRFYFPVPADAQKSNPPTFAFETPMKILQGQRVLKHFNVTKSKITLRQLISQIGRPVLINFWATWCPPCIEEFPSVEYLNRQLQPNNPNHPVLISISVDENERDVKKFYGTLGFEPSLVVLHDIDGEISRAFGTVKFPETYMLDAEGQILHKWIGPQNWLSNDVIQKLSSLQPVKN